MADESGLILARGFMQTSRGPDSRNERSGCADQLRARMGLGGDILLDLGGDILS